MANWFGNDLVAEEEVCSKLIMNYFNLDNPNKLKTELIDLSNLNEKSILKLIEKIIPGKPENFQCKLFLITSDKEILVNEIINFIQLDLQSIKEEFDFEEFEIEYFFSLYNPVTQMASFSCELKRKSGGGIIYDIVRVFMNENEYYLLTT